MKAYAIHSLFLELFVIPARDLDHAFKRGKYLLDRIGHGSLDKLQNGNFQEIELDSEQMSTWFEITRRERESLRLAASRHSDLGTINYHYQYDEVDNVYYRTNLRTGRLSYQEAGVWTDIEMYGPLEEAGITNAKAA
jgi:hypothetical protein